ISTLRERNKSQSENRIACNGSDHRFPLLKVDGIMQRHPLESPKPVNSAVRFLIFIVSHSKSDGWPHIYASYVDVKKRIKLDITICTLQCAVFLGHGFRLSALSSCVIIRCTALYIRIKVLSQRDTAANGEP